MAVSWPLKVSPNGRYLVDQAGVTFLICGDVAWNLEAELNLTDADTYLADRQGRGFNAVLFQGMEHFFSDNTPKWANYNGDLPFDSGNDFTLPNAKYWNHIEAIMEAAKARDMAVFFWPAYTGFAATTEGWYDVMASLGAAKMRTYGRWIGERFKNQSNLVYVLDGDRQPANKELIRQLAYGIVEKDTTAPKLMSSHLDRGTHSLDFWPSEFVTLNAVYTTNGVPVYQETREQYQLSRHVPNFFVEGYYEGDSHAISALELRKQIHLPLVSGACGAFFGNDTVWRFQGSYSSSFNSTGAQHAARAWTFWKQLYSVARPDLLTPDFDHSVVTAGYGTDGGSDYAPALWRSNGGRLVCYIPTSRNVTVNMSKIRGGASGSPAGLGNCFWEWVDPTNGASSGVQTIAASGSNTFTGPGNNAAGDGDWLLNISGG